jgi:predicted transcriptional regulator YdeE
MDDFTAVGLAEGFIESDDKKEITKAWQHLINTGLVNKLQGFFGRTAERLIEQGICKPKEK